MWMTGSDEPINGYFYPNQVPATQSQTAFALRVELVSTSYGDVIQSFSNQVSDGTLKASAFLPSQMKGVANVQVGTRLDGQIIQGQQGSMIVIQMRDKTLKVYTQSTNYLSDFNNIVLPSLKFTP